MSLCNRVINMLGTAMLMVISLACSSVASAQINCPSVGTGGSLSIAASYTFALDTSRNSYISPWLYTPSASLFSSCTFSDIGSVVLQVRSLLSDTGQTYLSNTGYQYSGYLTNVQGVGFILSARNSSSQTWKPVPSAAFISLPGSWSATSGPELSGQLIALDQRIDAGVLANVPIAEFRLLESSTGSTSPSVIMMSGTTRILTRSCSVNSASQNFNVSLPSIQIHQLPTVGSTAGTTAFNLRFDCVAGTKMYITFTDGSNPTNTSDTLSLQTVQSTAVGIGLRLTYGGVPVRLGPDSSGVGTLNQIAIGTAGGGQITVPFSVAYVRAGAQMTPGIVNAVTTFTMSYQ